MENISSHIREFMFIYENPPSSHFDSLLSALKFYEKDLQVIEDAPQIILNRHLPILKNSLL